MATLIKTEIYRDGGSLSAIVMEEGEFMAFWLPLRGFSIQTGSQLMSVTKPAPRSKPPHHLHLAAAAFRAGDEDGEYLAWWHFTTRRPGKIQK